MALDPRYQCPRCSKSNVDKKKNARFCSKFSKMLTEEEREKERFVTRHFMFYVTYECKSVYRGWNWNCAGFRNKK